MANQADRGGVQQLIEKWRARESICRRISEETTSSPMLAQAWYEEAEHIKVCADELEAALQGSVASPQVDSAYLNQVCDRIIETNGCAAHDWLVAVARTIKADLAGSGATIPAPQEKP